MNAPSFGTFGSGVPSPFYSSRLINRLVPQEGITIDRDAEWGTDTLTEPYVIGRPWVGLRTFPTLWDGHPTIPSMQFWDIRVNYGKVLASISLIYRGVIDGRIPPTNASFGLAPQDTTQLQTLQISDPNSSAVADVAFYCPQTTWRWVTLGYPATLPTAYATIDDPYGKKNPVPIRYVIRTDPGAAPSDLTGIYQTDETAFRTERWGPYWRNEITLNKRYASPFTA